MASTSGSLSIVRLLELLQRCFRRVLVYLKLNLFNAAESKVDVEQGPVPAPSKRLSLDRPSPQTWKECGLRNASILEDRHKRHWWNTAARPLAHLFDAAQYPPSLQAQHLTVFAKHCASHAGALPEESSWQSFMTDTGFPFELSWDWGWGDKPPMVRYSIEPVNLKAGTTLDPLNETASPALLDSLRQSFSVGDMTLYDYFSRTLLDYSTSAAGAIKAHKSQVFLAFDLDGPSITTKAYFIASRRAHAARLSDYAVIAASLRGLPDYDAALRPALAPIEAYMADAAARGARLAAEGLGIDCAPRAAARYKLYVRSAGTSAAAIAEVATLGGRIAAPGLDASLARLAALWAAVGGRVAPHRTGGVLFNFEVRPGRALAVPKVYLPVRHCAGSDAATADAVGAFVVEGGGDAVAVGRFRSALGDACGEERLRAGRGVFTYIGCTLDRGGVRVVSYMNPDYM